MEKSTARRRRRMVVGVASSLMLATCIGAQAHASTTSAVTKAPAARPQGQLLFVTSAELASAKQKHMSFDQLKNEITSTSSVKNHSVTPFSTNPGGNGSWADIYWTVSDSQGRTIPIRAGFSDAQNNGNGGGWWHACMDHNMCNSTIAQQIFGQSGSSQGNNKYQYTGVIVEAGTEVVADITAIQSQARIGPDGEGTPDGLPFGALTIYCDGWTNCPEWVNSVP